MIIDADTHISPTSEGGISITTDELLRRMDRAGVDKAVVWLQPPYLRHIDAANRYVYEASRAHPDRLLPFGWADPNLGVDKACEMVHRCVEEYGFYGIKLNGAQNNFYIDHPETSLPVIETIAATGRHIAFHIGTDAYEATHPFRLGKIAAMFPNMHIFMVHIGGVGFADLSNAAIEVMQQHPNITGIGSAIRAPHILKAVKTVGAQRVCFGSDTPFELMHVEVAKYRALLQDEVTSEEYGAIMSDNIRRLFGLSD
jgi:predicted TIM-barrel fold metal-dependent hydrolase